MDNFAILVGEGGDGDLDLFNGLLLETQVWQQRQATLHLLRDPVSESIRACIVGLATLLVLLSKETFCLFVKPLFEEFR